MSDQLDEVFLMGVQDVNDPVWESDAAYAEMTVVKDPADEYAGSPEYRDIQLGYANDYEGSPQYQDREPVRTITGALDFANGLVDSVADFLSTDDPVPVKAVTLKPVTTKQMGCDKWRARRALLTPQNSSPILVNSAFRRCIRLYNEGPNEAYLTSLPLSQLIPAGGIMLPNVFVLPPVTATIWPYITIETKDDLWGYCAVGESAYLNIIEEFDLEP